MLHAIWPDHAQKPVISVKESIHCLQKGIGSEFAPYLFLEMLHQDDARERTRARSAVERKKVL